MKCDGNVFLASSVIIWWDAFFPFFFRHDTFLSQDDVWEAYQLLLMNLEPAVPQEYILKWVVNAAMGQENGLVCMIWGSDGGEYKNGPLLCCSTV
jgi:hypothetical protein